MENKVWLVTGCSSGFGREIARTALEAGHRVAVTARDIESLEEFRHFAKDKVLLAKLDVTNLKSIKDSVSEVMSKFLQIDVLINNAGYGYYGIFEDLDLGELEKEMDVNFYGAVRTCQAVLPHMRQSRSGHIINISSIAGTIGTKGRSAYSASKFALNGISECLAAEIKDFGIKVTIVEPGAFRTSFFNNLSTEIPPTAKADYCDLVNQLNHQFAAINGKQKGNPKLAAKAILQLVDSENPPLRVPLGPDAVELMEKRNSLTRTELLEWSDWAIHTTFSDTVSGVS
ncbi:MAG: short-chain dehydrogenase/reductase [Mucilaginibacter sp.]|nr:short-chain dehydrogenase/reductase [Mucilaginibacter sp.]